MDSGTSFCVACVIAFIFCVYHRQGIGNWFCRPNYIVNSMQFHTKRLNMNEGRQKSCTGNNKIYILAKVDAHIERHVDLISELGLAVPTLNTTVETLR